MGFPSPVPLDTAHPDRIAYQLRFREMDLDHNQRISRDEFLGDFGYGPLGSVQARQQVTSRRQDWLRQTFRAMLRPRCKRLSTSDMLEYLKQYPDVAAELNLRPSIHSVEAMFRQADVRSAAENFGDYDGKLDEEEFLGFFGFGDLGHPYVQSVANNVRSKINAARR
mmetsp:Transcript_19774/g.54964  ORF Transcript_19774/g.54964 Transcript_19774/m.54964 type:complete len:167 (+) Transcript_19774:205-705(+)